MCGKARAQLAVFNNFIDLPAGSRIKGASNLQFSTISSVLLPDQG